MSEVSHVSPASFGADLTGKISLKPEFNHDFARYLSRLVGQRIGDELKRLGVDVDDLADDIENVSWAKSADIMDKIESNLMEPVNPVFEGEVVDVCEEKANAINAAFEEFFDGYLSEVDGPCELKHDFNLVPE